MKHEEDAIHAGIIDLLKLCAASGVIYYHVPNQRKCSEREGARFKRLGVIPGIPDIALVLANGHAAYLEIKTAKGTLSPEQKAFRSLCQAYHIPYAVVRSITEAQAVLMQWGALRGLRGPEGAMRREGTASGTVSAVPVSTKEMLGAKRYRFMGA